MSIIILKESVKKSQKPVFGHFIKFGCCGMPDIAYSDRGKWPLAIDSNQGCGNPLNLCIIVTIKHKRAKNEAFGHCYQVNRPSSCTICLNILEPMLQKLSVKLRGFMVVRFEGLNT